MDNKVVYTIKDMQEMLGVKYSTASKIIRQVKAYQDNLGISGIILKTDWETYTNRQKILNKGEC